MLYAQIKHPVTTATLLFLVTASLAIRWNEYRLPRYAHRVEAMGIALVKSPAATPLADAANAALLYEEAFHLLYPNVQENRDLWDEEDDTPLTLISERYSWDRTLSRYVALGSVPESSLREIRPALEMYLEQRRDALALLYRATNIPSVSWSAWGRPGVPRSRSWLWHSRIANLLLMDALLHLIDDNEAGALRALTSLDAFVRAAEQLDPPIGWGREMLLSWPFRVILGFGIEKKVFSDRALDIVSGIVSFKEDPAGSALLTNRIWDGGDSYGWEDWHDTVLGAGSFWYALRYSSRNSMKEVMLYELLLTILPSGALWEGNGSLVDTIQQISEMNYFIYSLGRTVDPYSSDKRIIYRHKCDSWALLNLLLRTWRGVQMRTALRVVIALEKYQRRTGAFPDSLDALTPADVSPDLLYMARYMIDYRKKQQGWELWGIREVPDLYRLRVPVFLYTYPLLTP